MATAEMKSTSTDNNCDENEIVWEDVQYAFGNRIQIGIMVNKTHIDPKLFLHNCCNVFKRKVNHVFKEVGSLKINAVLCCEFKVIKDERELLDLKYMDSKSAPLYKFDDFENWYAEFIEQPILSSIEELQEHDTGWSLSAIVDLTVTINKYTMLLGGTFVELPIEIKLKKACVNLQNDDDACFAWAVVSALNPIRSGSNRIKNYPKYENVLNLKDIEFPMTIKQIPQFERQNKMSINVFSLQLNLEKKTNDKFIVQPTYVTRDVKETHINLLLIQSTYDNDTEYEDDEDVPPVKYHYVWIKHLSRLLSSQLSGNRSQKYICNRCLHYFSSQKKLNEHLKNCYNHNVRIRLPKRESRLIEFKNYSRKKKAPFVIYAALNCLFSEIKSYQKCVPLPCNIAYYVKCSYDPTLSFYRSYRGEDCISWFTSELKQFADDVGTVFICAHPKIKMTTLEEEKFNDTIDLCLCFVCQKPFTESCKRLPNHCRFTGAYRGPAHELCNMNYKDNTTIPVFFNKLNNFDSYLLMEHLKKDFENRIDVNVITNKNSFITFTKRTDGIIKFRFNDTFQFMSDSLDTLASYLPIFPVFKSEMSHLTDEQINILTKKIVYPGRYFTSICKFLETNLPSMSELGDISESDYDQAKRIWNEFQVENLGEYSDLCLKTNVLLLAEVFEEFRDKCLENYKLDPSYYHTFSAYTWDAMLQYTNVSLELFTEIDMVRFIENGYRGGLSQCSARYTKANNKYLDGYIYTKPSKYLMYFGVNNQYDWAMSQYLPYGKFEWVEDLNKFCVESIPDDSLVGYILEVDLEYPSDLHDIHKDLPFCPEYQSSPDSHPQEKLMSTLHNKFNYIIHYRNLKQVLKHGLILTKTHRILQFEQSPWLKTYIDLNRFLSASAKNNFERNLFELMSYTVFEKLAKNIETHGNIKLVTKWEGRYGAEANVSKQEFKSSTIINNKMVVLELNSNEIYLNKPIYLGMCISDLAKTILYDFHYEYMQEKFGRYCTICYTDTDTLLYEITSIDIYESMRADCERQFDTSDYPHDNIWNIPRVNKKVLGLIKDKNMGRIVSEFVGLRSKMYSVKLNSMYKPMHLYDMDKKIVTSRIKYEDYMVCLANKNQTNVSLNLNDNKRYLKENGCETLPWGHYSLLT